MQKQIAWNTGDGNITLTYTGQGNGSISVSSDANDLDTERSQTIRVQTTNGAVVKNLIVKQAACPVPVGTVLNYPYSGAVKEVLLPAGRYKLQCWGAQGGTAGSYAGGKGGYSEGEITLTKPTTLYIFVGGKGAASGNGGWNGGGGGSGSATYTSGGTKGNSKMACGGGATDISLATSSMTYSSYRTNRSDASLLARMIVAGGGSGGAYTDREETITQTKYTPLTKVKSREWFYTPPTGDPYYVTDYTLTGWQIGDTIYLQNTNDNNNGISLNRNGQASKAPVVNNTITYTITEGTTALYLQIFDTRDYTHADINKTSADIVTEETITNTSSANQAGYAGGGTTGGGYSSAFQGKQNAAGTNGGFGYGANQTTTNYRHCSACGGGGWYGGGGGDKSDTGIDYVKRSGGGSGFVNTVANASYRPNGYTGLQLDSGTTYAGTTSFEAVNGGKETGHSGDGYARITRIS